MLNWIVVREWIGSASRNLSIETHLVRKSFTRHAILIHLGRRMGYANKVSKPLNLLICQCGVLCLFIMGRES